jgi:hypothetical protein
MLEWTQEQNFEVGTGNWVMYVTGLRVGSSPAELVHGLLGCEVEGFKRSTEWDFITVREKFREVYTFEMDKRVGDMVVQLIGDRKTGLIFQCDVEAFSTLNRAALEKFLPELAPSIEMPNHFYRHMCAQHLRQMTGGNTGLCAGMMHCSKQSFDESYGGITSKEVEEGKHKYLHMLGA